MPKRKAPHTQTHEIDIVAWTLFGEEYKLYTTLLAQEHSLPEDYTAPEAHIDCIRESAHKAVAKLRGYESSLSFSLILELRQKNQKQFQV
jgi:hypothetical protein